MTRLYTSLLCILVGMILIGPLTGCATETRAEAKSKAIERWKHERTRFLYGVARQAFDVGELDEAERACQGVLAEDPLNLPYVKLWARIQLERGQLEPAMTTLNHAVKVDETDAETHYLLGVVHQRWQNYEAALRAYQKSFDYESDNVRGLLALTEMLVKLDRSDEAIAGLESRLVYFEYSAAIRVALGRIHAMHHDYDQAAKLYREASLLAPEDQQIIEHLALALMAVGDHAETIRLLTDLLDDKAFAERRDLRLTLADAHMASGDVAGARSMYIELTREAPNYVDGWIKLGQAAWLLGDDRRVAAAAHHCITLRPDRYEGYLLRGMLTQKAGNLGEAQAYFARAGELVPQNPLPLILSGMGLEKAGQPRAAADAYTAALRVAPEDMRARQLLARLEPDGDR